MLEINNIRFYHFDEIKIQIDIQTEIRIKARVIIKF
jgi:hypothetical protein